jgi:hypothetical protein
MDTGMGAQAARLAGLRRLEPRSYGLHAASARVLADVLLALVALEAVAFGGLAVTMAAGCRARPSRHASGCPSRPPST